MDYRCIYKSLITLPRHKNLKDGYITYSATTVRGNYYPAKNRVTLSLLTRVQEVFLSLYTILRIERDYWQLL